LILQGQEKKGQTWEGELLEPKPAIRSVAQERKPKMPRIYNLSGRPALAAAT